MLIVQMHYNTLSAAPVADQSTVQISLADTVERVRQRLASGSEDIREPVWSPFTKQELRGQ